jgi:nitrous oxide reductase accessory protein NosL
MKAKLILSLVMVAALTACSTTKTAEAPIMPVKPAIEDRVGSYPGPVLKLKNYDGPEAMEEQQVLTAQRNCILNRMIPMTHEVQVRTEYGKTPVTVRVSCVAPLP